MNTQNIKLKEITIHSVMNDICVKGTAFQNNLSYETSFLINSTQLNIIINQLQAMNEEVEVAAQFQQQPDAQGNSFYWMNLDALNYTNIAFESFAIDKQLRQIRA